MTQIDQNWLNSQEWTEDVETALHKVCQRSWFSYGMWLKITEDVEREMDRESDRATWASFVRICRRRGISFKKLVEDAMLPAGDANVVGRLQTIFGKRARTVGTSESTKRRANIIKTCFCPPTRR